MSEMEVHHAAAYAAQAPAESNHGQLWQRLKITSPADMVGNVDALSELKGFTSGFLLLHGPMGCGKTSLALALCAARTGIHIEESQTVHQMGNAFAQHIHALDFDLGQATAPKWFFYTRDTVFIIIDESQNLTATRQQSRLKTLPARPDLTLCFCTTNPEKLDPALYDRCVKIRLGPLSAREVPLLVKKACAARGIPFDVEIVRALNRGSIFRPRAIISAVDAVAAGKSFTEAVAGQHT
jgi:DNA polymerase III delta prime subunit